MKVSDYIAKFLHEQNVTHVFEVIGGMLVHMLDSIHQQQKIQIVSCHHEQAAAFAAEAFGRLTGIPGVAMGTSGPGATNLLTGIGSCYFDSSPAVFITGQVNRYELKGNRPIRQLGFQETDIVSMARPITKGAWQIQEPEDVPKILHQAFELAREGRPGPVLVDIPMDIQRAEIEPPPAKTADNLQDAEVTFTEDIFEDLFEQIQQAARPLILTGGGIRAAQAADELRAFAKMLGVPVVNSLMAVDVMPAGDPLRVGMIGSYGNRWANLAISRSDFLLVLGSRLDIRQTGAKTEEFKGNRKIFHVDCVAGEVNNRVQGCKSVIGNVRAFLQKGRQAATGHYFKDHSSWLAEINELRSEWPDTKEVGEITGINPNTFMHHLSDFSGPAAVYAIDVGQHQMWAAQSLKLHEGQRFLTSGGMGSMGFALPAAIGAAAILDKAVVVVAGDGGFQVNIQELQTVVRKQLPIKMVILNNNAHGMVRQFQQSYFESRYQSTVWGYSAPDFARVAEAYGVAARTIEAEKDVSQALEWFWEDPTKPALLQVMIDTHTNAYPKIAFGRPIGEMEPLFQPVEIEST